MLLPASTQQFYNDIQYKFYNYSLIPSFTIDFFFDFERDHFRLPLPMLE